MPQDKKLTDAQLETLTKELTVYAEEGATDDDLKQFREAYIKELDSKEGEDGNFTTASSEQSEGATTTSSPQEQSEQQGEVGTEEKPKVLGTIGGATIGSKVGTDRDVEAAKKVYEAPDEDLDKYFARKAKAGVADLTASIYRTPEFVWDVAANAYNLLLEGQDYVTGTESIKVPTSDAISDKIGIDNIPAKTLENYAQKQNEVDSKYNESIITSIQEGDYATAAISTAGSITESLPFTLSLLIPAAAGASAARTFTATSAVMGAGRKQDLVEDEDLSETQKNVNSIVHGIAEGFEVLLGAGSAGRAIRKVAEEQGVKEAKKFTKDVFENVLKDNVYLQPFSESIQEGITTYTQNLADIYVNGEDKEVTEGLADAMIVGAVMGGGFTGAAQGVKAIKKISNKNKEGGGTPQFTDKELASLEEVAFDESKYNQLNQEITDMVEVGEIEQSEADALRVNLAETVDAVRAIPSSLDAKQKRDALSLVKEKQQLKRNIEGKDEALVAPQKERIKAIEEELTAIVTPKQNEQTKENQDGTVRDNTQEKDSSQEAQESPNQEAESTQTEEELRTVNGEDNQAESVRDENVSRLKPTENAEELQSTEEQVKKVFPKTKVLNKVYHNVSIGKDVKKLNFNKFNNITSKGFHFSDGRGSEFPINNRTASVYLDIKNPAPNEYPDNLTNERIAELKDKGYDGVISENSFIVDSDNPYTEYVAFDSNQIHIITEANQESTTAQEKEITKGAKVDVTIDEFNDRGKKVKNDYQAEVVAVNEDGTYDLKYNNATFKNVTPDSIKKVPRQPRTSVMDEVKQGFIEYTEAMKEKSAQKIKAVTDSYKSKLKEVKQKAKDKEASLKGQKDLLVGFANDLVKGLKESGVKEISTAKVTTILNQVKKSNTQESVDKAAAKLIEITQGIEESFKKSEISKIRDKIKKDTSSSKLKDRRSSGIVKGKKVDENTFKILNAINKSLVSKGEGVQQRIEELESKENKTDDEILELAGLNLAQGLNSENLENVKKAQQEINQILEEGKSKLAERLAERSADYKKGAEDFIEAATGGKGVKRGFAKKALDKERKTIGKRVLDKIAGFLDLQEGLRTLLDKIDRTDKRNKDGFGGVLDELMYKPIAEGRNKKNKLTREGMGMVTKYLDELYGKKRDKALAANQREESLGVFVDANGNAVEMVFSQNQAARMYQYKKSPDNDGTFDKMGWTDEMHNAVDNSLTPEMKQFADWQMNTFYPTYYKMVNEVYKDLNYIDLGINENFVPIVREKSNLKDTRAEDMAGGDFVSPEVTYGSLKGRKGSVVPFDMSKGSTDVLLEYMEGMNHYIAFAKPIKKASIIVTTPSVKEAVNQNNPRETYRALKEFIEGIANSNIDAQKKIDLLDKLRGNTTIASLALAPVVFIKQLTSLPAYATNIPTKAFITGLGKFAANPIKAYKTISQSEYIIDRLGKGFDRDQIIAMKKDWDDMLKTNGDLSMAGIKDKLMFLTKWGDIGAIVMGGYSVYDYHYNKELRAGKTPAEANKTAMYEFEEATKMSQQSSNTEDLSHFQRGGSLAKLFTMYMTSPIAYFRQERKGARDFVKGYQNKDKKAMANGAKRFAMYHILLPTLFQYIASGMPAILKEWEDDDEDDLLMAMALGSLNGVFLFGSMVEYFGDLLTDKPWANMGFSATPAFDSVIELLDQSAKVIETWRDESKMSDDVIAELIDLGFELDNLVGLPIDRVKKMYESWEMVAEDSSSMTTGEQIALMIGWSPYQILPKKGESSGGGTVQAKPKPKPKPQPKPRPTPRPQ